MSDIARDIFDRLILIALKKQNIIVQKDENRTEKSCGREKINQLVLLKRRMSYITAQVSFVINKLKFFLSIFLITVDFGCCELPI